MALFSKLGGAAKVGKVATKAFEGTITARADEVPDGTPARMKTTVGKAEAGDLGTIRQKLLPRGRGVETSIVFDDGVSVDLPAGTPVYPSLRGEASGFAKGFARGVRSVGRGALKADKKLGLSGSFGDIGRYYLDDGPKRTTRKAKPKTKARKTKPTPKPTLSASRRRS